MDMPEDNLLGNWHVMKPWASELGVITITIIAFDDLKVVQDYLLLVSHRLEKLNVDVLPL